MLTINQNFSNVVIAHTDRYTPLMSQDGRVDQVPSSWQVTNASPFIMYPSKQVSRAISPKVVPFGVTGVSALVIFGAKQSEMVHVKNDNCCMCLCVCRHGRI